MSLSVIFDLDGTLVDLPVDIESARQKIGTFFAERGYTEPMRPILEAINRAAASVATDDREIYPLILQARRILDVAELEAAEKASVRPGAREAVSKLQGLSIRMGIVTNNGSLCVGPALQAMGLDVRDFQVSARDDVRRPKPSPDGLIRVASHLGTTGDEMFFIGDSPVDVSAAVAANPQVAANLRAIAVPGPRSSEAQLRMAGPCVVCPDLVAAVDNILQNYAR